MKNLSFFLIIFSILINPVKSEIPDYEIRDLNKNIIEHRWKVNRTNFIGIKGYSIELYTLSKNGYILKCQVAYFQDRLETYCMEP